MKKTIHVSPASAVSTESPAAAAPKPRCAKCGSNDTSFIRNEPNRRMARPIATVWLPLQKLFVCRDCGNSWIHKSTK